jgi:3-oxosteroid 1-dehydrogenase
VPLLDAAEMGLLYPKLRQGPMPFPVTVPEIRNVTLAPRTPKGMLLGAKVLMRMRKAKSGPP